MQSHTSLTLCWCSFQNEGSDHVDFTYTDKGSQNLGYASFRLNQFSITLLERQQMVGAQLMLNVTIRQWPCRFLLGPSWLSLRWLCIMKISSISNRLTFKDKNCWDSIDAHFQNGAVTASLSILPIKAANMFVMHIRKHISIQLAYLHDQ